LRSRLLLVICAALAALVLTSCQTTATPATTASVQDARELIDLDPRLGAPAETTAGVSRRLDPAIRDIRAGRLAEAKERLATLERRNPDYLPIDVATAGIAIREERLDDAQRLLDGVLEKHPEYLAASAYAAEIARQRGDLEKAYTILKSLDRLPDAPPVVREAFAAQRDAWFNDLFARASSTTDSEEAISLLRQALLISPEADAPRLLLVNRLIAGKRFDDARRQLEPLVQKNPGSEDVETALAEIEVGKGRYQEAITRYERLARVNPARHSPRLNEIKERWLEENMPPQYHDAISSGAVSRAELAVLMYWKVPAVRFAQNLSQPPIAIDVAGVAGRDEFVRALALRLYQVDPITRTAGPDRMVTSGTFVRLAGRLLTLRGVPTCASGVSVQNELERAEAMLSACGVSLGSLAADPDLPVSGRVVAEILEAVGRAAR
jgi:tetratricopeptide (TPR) repeat protein